MSSWRATRLPRHRRLWADLDAPRWTLPRPSQGGTYYFRYRSTEPDGFVGPTVRRWSSRVRDWRFLWLLAPLLFGAEHAALHFTSRLSCSASNCSVVRLVGHAVGRGQFARALRELLDRLHNSAIWCSCPGVVDQALHGLRHRVVALRHAVGREAHARRAGFLARRIGLGLDDARRVAHRRGTWPAPACHHRARVTHRPRRP